MGRAHKAHADADEENIGEIEAAKEAIRKAQQEAEKSKQELQKVHEAHEKAHAEHEEAMKIAQEEHARTLAEELLKKQLEMEKAKTPKKKRFANLLAKTKRLPEKSFVYKKAGYQ